MALKRRTNVGNYDDIDLSIEEEENNVQEVMKSEVPAKQEREIVANDELLKQFDDAGLEEVLQIIGDEKQQIEFLYTLNRWTHQARHIMGKILTAKKEEIEVAVQLFVDGKGPKPKCMTWKDWFEANQAKLGFSYRTGDRYMQFYSMASFSKVKIGPKKIKLIESKVKDDRLKEKLLDEALEFNLSENQISRRIDEENDRLKSKEKKNKEIAEKVDSTRKLVSFEATKDNSIVIKCADEIMQKAMMQLFEKIEENLLKQANQEYEQLKKISDI